MKTKLFTFIMAFTFLFSSTQVEGFSLPDPEEQPVDQFLGTVGVASYILWEAMNVAKEHDYRYFKILSAEYTFGNQSGSFVCPREDNDPGEIFTFEDKTIKILISCQAIEPKDPEYIDAEIYQNLFSMLEELQEEGFFDEEGGFLNDNNDSEDDNDIWSFGEEE